MPKLSTLIDSGKWVDRFYNQIKPPISTPEDLFERDTSTLASALNCSYEEVADCKRRVARKLLSLGSAETVSNLPNAIPLTMEKQSNLTSGFANFDAMFNNTLPSGQIISLLGESSSGKSQLCMMIAVTAAMQGKKVLFIDSNNQLSLKQLHSMISYILVDEQLTLSATLTQEDQQERMTQALENIHVNRCFDLWNALNLLTKLHENIENYDIIIIDSLHHWISSYLAEQNERTPFGTMSENGPSELIGNVHPLISQLMLLLRNLIAKNDKISLITTNSLVPFTKLQRSLSESGLHRSASIGGGSIQQTCNLGGPYHFMDIFEIVIILTNQTNISQTQDNQETIIQAVAVIRPPYYKACPEKAMLSFPWY